MGIGWTIIKLVEFLKDYVVPLRIGIYCYLSIVALTMLLMNQFARVIERDTSWALGLTPCLLWVKMLYWVWQQKYSSLKKN